MRQVLFYADHPSYFAVSPCAGKTCPTMISPAALLGLLTTVGLIVGFMLVGAIISKIFFTLSRCSSSLGALYMIVLASAWCALASSKCPLQ